MQGKSGAAAVAAEKSAAGYRCSPGPGRQLGPQAVHRLRQRQRQREQGPVDSNGHQPGEPVLTTQITEDYPSLL